MPFSRRTSRSGLALALILVLFAAALAGCASRGPEPAPRTPKRPAATEPAPKPGDDGFVTPAPRGTFRPYSQFGRTYHPMTSVENGFVEEGLASWYGLKFHGRRTSNGETYDMYAMTAAHRILPMGTRLRVENLENGRVAEVRVNDRGPFVDPDKRIIDLSFAAARELGTDKPGLARVRITSVGAIEGFTGTDIAGNFYVQVGAFSMKSNAERLAARLSASGFEKTRVEEADVDGTTFWRVQAGVFPSLNAAEEGKERLAREFPGAFVIADR